jgi:hypothetical protein
MRTPSTSLSPGARLGWLIAGFLAATAVAAILEVRPAVAQETARDRETRPPEGLTQPETATRPFRTIPPDAEIEDGGTGDAAVSGETQPDASAAAADPQEAEFLRTLPGRRRIVTDGDVSESFEPQTPADGVLEPPEAQDIVDDSDPSEWDTRTQEEIALFENPPAGHDPLLFLIEDIDPLVTDRRPARLFRLEPYDPVGIAIGSFVLFPETEINGLWTSNVLDSPKAQSDVAAEERSKTRLVSDWSVHAVELRATNLLSFYDEFTSEDDRAWSIEGRGRLDVTRRTNVQALLLHDLHQESRTAIDATGVGPRPDVTTNEAAMSINHRFYRLSLQLRGSLTDVEYSKTAADLGEDRNSTTVEETVRAGWEFKPQFALFTEAGINQRAYETFAASDGIGRDSFGERYRLGVDFGSTGQTLRGEASIGFGRQTPNDDRLSDVDGFLFDSNLAWRASELTSFFLIARTDLYDTNTAGSAGVVARLISLEARHAFRRYFVVTAGLTYSKNDYDNVAIVEHEWSPKLTAEYYVNREITLFGRYEHAAWRSNAPDGDYDVDDVRFGVRFRR